MMKGIVGGLTLLLLEMGLVIRPAVIFAQLPVLNVNFTAQDLTNGSNWQNPLTVNTGDRIRFRAILTNSSGVTASDVTVRMPLFESVAKIQYPTFHILCLNASPPDATLQINSDAGGVIHYIPGSAAMIRSGVRSQISPDTATANITTQQISVGDIAVGSEVTFEYDVSLDSASVNPTPTSVPGNTAATSSAVAKSAPKTALGDNVWFLTCGWLVTAFSGLKMRKLAAKILV